MSIPPPLVRPIGKAARGRAHAAPRGEPQACGWLTDRFGVRWQIVPRLLDKLMKTGDATRGKRVADAMLQMVKLDIATLQKAYG